MATVYRTWGPVGSGADYTSDATLTTDLSDGATFAGDDVILQLFPDCTVFLTSNRTWTLTNINSLTVQMLNGDAERTRNRFRWWDAPLPAIGASDGLRTLLIKKDGGSVTFKHIELRLLQVQAQEITATTGGAPFEFLNCRGRGMGDSRWVRREGSANALTVLVENFIGWSAATPSGFCEAFSGNVANDTRMEVRHATVWLDNVGSLGTPNIYRNLTCYACIGVITNGQNTPQSFNSCAGDDNISNLSTVPTGSNNQANVAVADIFNDPNYFRGTSTFDSTRLYTKPDFTIKVGGAAYQVGTPVGAETDFGGNSFGNPINIGALASPSDADPNTVSVIASAAVGETRLLGRSVFERTDEFHSRLLDYDNGGARGFGNNLGGGVNSSNDAIGGGSFGVAFASLNSSGLPMFMALAGGHTTNVMTHVPGMAANRDVKNLTPGRVPPIFRSFVVTGDTVNGSPTVTNVSDMTNIYKGAAVTGTGLPGWLIDSVNVPGNSFTMNGNASATNTGVSITIKEYDFEGDYVRYHTYHGGAVINMKLEDGSTAKVLWLLGAAAYSNSANFVTNKPTLFNLDTQSYIEPGSADNAETFPANFANGNGMAVVEPNGAKIHLLYQGGNYSTVDGTKKASEGRMTAVGSWSNTSDMTGCFAPGSCFADSQDSIIYITTGLTGDGKLHRFRIDTRAVSEITITPTDGNDIPTDSRSRYLALHANPRNPNQFFLFVGRDGYYTLNLVAGTFTSTKTFTPTRTGQNADIYPTKRGDTDGSEAYITAQPLDVPNAGLIVLHAPKAHDHGTVMFTKLAATAGGSSPSSVVPARKTMTWIYK